MKTKRGRQSIILTFVLMLLFSSFKVISVASVENWTKLLMIAILLMVLLR